jgi:hypothetical protein
MAPKASFWMPPPQLGEILAHHMEGVFHCYISDGFLQGCPASILIPLCKDLDDRDGIVTLLEEGINIMRQSELSQRVQCASAASAHLSVTPSWVFSWTRPILVHKGSLFAGGTRARALYVVRMS